MDQKVSEPSLGCRKRTYVTTVRLHPAGGGAEPSRAAFGLELLSALLARHVQGRVDQAVPHSVVLGRSAVPASLKFQLTFPAAFAAVLDAFFPGSFYAALSARSFAINPSALRPRGPAVGFVDDVIAGVEVGADDSTFI